MVFKWRFHFYRVLDDVRHNASNRKPPYGFRALEDYMDGFRVEYLDIATLPSGFLEELRAEGEITEGWHFIDVASGVIYIFYDPTVSPERQRFTIAHEWGHILQRLDTEFKADVEAIPDAKERTEIIESVANHIAAYYLAPHPILKRELDAAVRDRNEESYIIDRLAKRFRVSQQVISISFMNCRPRLQIR